jgi:hypothetical protein
MERDFPGITAFVQALKDGGFSIGNVSRGGFEGCVPVSPPQFSSYMKRRKVKK